MILQVGDMVRTKDTLVVDRGVGVVVEIVDYRPGQPGYLVQFPVFKFLVRFLETELEAVVE